MIRNPCFVIMQEPAPSSNWMCFVRTLPCGWAAARANLRPFEYRNRIYFRTTRDVPVGEELIVRELQKHQSSADKNGTSNARGLLNVIKLTLTLKAHALAPP